ncbi:hypothetical protein DCS_02773 [Drechmeria coniospora]|uniref:Uncharacterized protein n=1 Tax=Drechmeria coniospora TaxID=98403 RepID=A0A151GX23_DRECN|nr:hypothetical protein DCS_02773 [Drechmeria coniospora]KYK61630.1 hypothetical protein DCS_02773 [Drechmeria coniospora]ODA79892.1 hypothetical protein RJ55_05489 [Drechmeria coniospora]
MASSYLTFIKTLFVPAIISLVVFLALTFVLVPFWRRYRSRYSQYLPLDTISNHTTSLRHRIMGRFTTFTPLSTFLSGRFPAGVVPGSSVLGSASPTDGETGDEDGEELEDVDEETWRAIDWRVSSIRPDLSTRLGRELEAGFMDDSDEGDDDHDGRRRP